MKGLILKDLLGVKSTLVALSVMLCIPILMCVLGAILGVSIATMAIVSATATLCLMSMIMAINFGAYDESCGLDSFAPAFPVNRTKIVMAPYCTDLLVMLVSSLIIFIVEIICLMSEGMPLAPEYPAVYVIFVLLISAITNPIIYKFGAQIGSYVISGIIALLGLFATAASNTLGDNISDKVIDAVLKTIFNRNTLNLAIISGLVICVIFFLLSMLISIFIYKKKDL